MGLPGGIDLPVGSEDLATRSKVIGRKGRKEEKGLNVCTLWGRVHGRGQREQRYLEGGSVSPVLLPSSAVVCPSPPEEILMFPKGIVYRPISPAPKRPMLTLVRKLLPSGKSSLNLHQNRSY